VSAINVERVDLFERAGTRGARHNHSDSAAASSYYIKQQHWVGRPALNARAIRESSRREARTEPIAFAHENRGVFELQRNAAR
jgi:hypothetical protein